MSTADYYNNNAQIFFDSTYRVDMQSLYEPFFKYFPTQVKILDLDLDLDLDLGCGSGGDTLYFKNRGYQVDVIDDSAELVVKVRELTGVKVNQLSFSASQIRP